MYSSNMELQFNQDPEIKNEKRHGKWSLPDLTKFPDLH